MDYSPLIDAFEAGSKKLRDAVAGLTPAQLTAFPVPGTWSIHQIVVHLLESDLVATHRMRRIIAEDVPLLIAYDETAFAKVLSYHQTPLGLTLDLFELNRKFMAVALRPLAPAAFARVGVHNQNGKVALADMLKMYVGHVDHHLKFIHEKRKLVGG